MYYNPGPTAINQRFKLILIATALIHGAFVFYRLGSDRLIFSAGEMTESLSVKVLLQEAISKPITKRTVRKTPKKKVISKRKVAKPISKVEEIEEAPQEKATNQTPRQAFKSRILNYNKPIYPRLAQRRGITGTVILNLFISNSGKMEKILIVQSSGSKILDNSALKAAKQWKFRAIDSQSTGVSVVEKRIVYKIN